MEKDKIIKKYLNKEKLTSEEDKFLKNLRDETIEKQKEKISSADIENITTYISAFSLATLGEYEYSISEKNLRLFKNIKNVIFLATEESKEDSKKEKLSIEKKGIDVEILYVDSEDYEEAYGILLKEIESRIYSSSDLDMKNFIIDNTLGPKMLGYSLYKFSIDQGCKLITWNTDFDKVSKKRIPGSETINYIESPQFKNSSIIIKINKLLEAFKFEEAAELATTIQNMEQADIFEKISKIFSIDSMCDYFIFKEELENFTNISTKKYSPSIKFKLDEILNTINQFLELDEDSQVINYSGIVYEFFTIKFKENYSFKQLIKNSIMEAFESIEKWDEYKEKITNVITKKRTNHHGDRVSEELSEILKTGAMGVSCIALEEIIKILEYDFPQTIKWKDEFLYIDKYGIKINLIEEFQTREKEYKDLKFKNLATNSIGKTLLKELFRTNSFEVSDDLIKEIIEYKDKDEGALNTALSRLNKFIKLFNEFILEIIKEKYPLKYKILKNQDFVIYEKQKVSKNEKKITATEEYLFILKINPKYI